MITPSAFSELVHRILTHPTGGVVGLVDELLAACRECDLQLEWQTDGCRVTSSWDGEEATMDVPLRKSVLRAILARVAVLCNERSQNSVSPYEGEGEIVTAGSPLVFRVAFTNTPQLQKLELTRIRPQIVDSPSAGSWTEQPKASA